MNLKPYRKQWPGTIISSPHQFNNHTTPFIYKCYSLTPYIWVSMIQCNMHDLRFILRNFFSVKINETFVYYLVVKAVIILILKKNSHAHTPLLPTLSINPFLIMQNMSLLCSNFQSFYLPYKLRSQHWKYIAKIPAATAGIKQKFCELCTIMCIWKKGEEIYNRKLLMAWLLYVTCVGKNILLYKNKIKFNSSYNYVIVTKKVISLILYN